jgi:hypothetical protein
MCPPSYTLVYQNGNGEQSKVVAIFVRIMLEQTEFAKLIFFMVALDTKIEKY